MQCSAEPIARQPRRSSEPLAIAGVLCPLAWVLGRWESIRESIEIEKCQRDAGMWPCGVVVVTNERSHLLRVVIPDACAAIIGPPARASLAALPEEAIESAMGEEIGWAREHGPSEYLVLTSARAWLFFARHRIVSKIDAGVRAAAHDAEPAVIEAALRRQRGAAAAIPTDAAERFADRVERLIRRP